MRSLSRLGRAIGLVAALATLGLAAPATATAAPATTEQPAVTQTTGDVSIQATERSMRCARAAKAAGWTGNNLVISVAVSLAESSCVATAQHWNGPTSGCPNGSLDRGAWQINNCYHAWVSDSCAYDLNCNARSAYTIYGWSGWGAWATYNNGAYLNYWSEAQAGVNAIGSAIYGTVTSGGDGLNIRSGPGTSYSVVGALSDGATVQIICQVRGESVYSEVYGIWTDLWDKIGSGQYVSDGYVYTGSNGQVAPTC